TCKPHPPAPVGDDSLDGPPAALRLPVTPLHSLLRAAGVARAAKHCQLLPPVPPPAPHGHWCLLTQTNSLPLVGASRPASTRSNACSHKTDSSLTPPRHGPAQSSDWAATARAVTPASS